MRELARKISDWFQLDSMRITDTELSMFCDQVAMQVSSLLTSPKVRDAESGAVLMEFMAIRYLI